MPADVSIAPLDEGSFLAATFGESDVLELRYEGMAIRAIQVTAPVGCTSPAVVAAGDANADGRTDGLIFDSVCGPWIALSLERGLVPTAWSEFFPAIPPNHYLWLEDIDADGDHEIMSGNTSALQGLHRESDGTWTSFLVPTVDPPNLNQIIAPAFATLYQGSQALLLQRGAGSISVFDVVNVSGRLKESTVLRQDLTDYLSSFDAIDQLTKLRAIDDCSALAIGVGIFLENSRNLPRPAVLLEASSAAYTANRLLSTLSEVLLATEFQVFENEYVGLLGYDESGRAGLEILRRDSCAGFASVAYAPIDSMPEWDDEALSTVDRIVATAGQTLLVVPLDDEVRLMHYDGKNILAFDWNSVTNDLSQSRRSVAR